VGAHVATKLALSCKTQSKLCSYPSAGIELCVPAAQSGAARHPFEINSHQFEGTFDLVEKSLGTTYAVKALAVCSNQVDLQKFVTRKEVH